MQKLVNIFSKLFYPFCLDFILYEYEKKIKGGFQFQKFQERLIILKKSGLIAILLTLFFFCPESSANQGDPTDLKFQRIYEGMTSGRITAIYQDKFDYIWVGTNSGLHKYNGIDFQIYTNNSQSNSIISNYVGYIYEDTNGNLLIGTAGGINKYNRNTDDFERIGFEGSNLNNPETSSGINTILQDKHGTIWVAGGDEMLYKLDEKKSLLIPYDSIQGVIVNSILKGSTKNSLWLTTTNEGLIKLNTATGEILKQYTHDPNDPFSLSTNSIESIVRDKNGDIWLGTIGDGLFRMETNEEETHFHQYKHDPGNPNSLGNNFVFSLHIDRDGNLWIGNENGGLHFYSEEDDNFHRYFNDPQNQHSLTDDSIWVIFQDRTDRYWIGTGQTGLNVADRYNNKFTNYHEPILRGGLKSSVIRDVQEDHNGNIWLATDGGGVSYFNRKTESLITYTHDSENARSIASDAVIHLNKDESGKLWVGTFRGGLNILMNQDNGEFISFQELIGNYEFPLENVFAVHFDQQFDYSWIVTLGEGIYRYDKNSDELVVFNTNEDNPNQFPTNFATSIFEDSNYNLWIATQEGLTLLKSNNKKEGHFQHFVHDKSDPFSLPGNVILQISEDNHQNIWIATTEGLAKFDPETESFVTFTTEDGLPSNVINSLVLDDYGNFWIGTNQGISHFNPGKGTFKNYTRNDGLQGDEFSRYSVRKLSSGELIFGGMNGFNIFHPDNVIDNPIIPPVYITDFKLLNKTVEIGGSDSPLDKHISVTDTLILSHSQNIFTFEFIALNYTQTLNNQYAYMMEGFENDWNYVGTQRNATYTNLNPGKYTFRVKASNNDGVWNEEGTSLEIIILPPFWQTYWFYFLTSVFILCLIYGMYRQKVRSIRDRNKSLEEEVAARTKDLKETLQKLKSSQNEVVEKAHKAGMADIATGVLHNVGNILNSVNTSTTLIKETMHQSKIDKLIQANEILREHIEHIDQFIAENPKGKKLMQYYLKLEKPIKNEHKKVLQQVQRLSDKIDLINEVVSAQQSYAGASLHNDQISLENVINNALSLQAGSIERHSLNIIKNLEDTDPVVAQRSKLIHVLVNIIKNAKESMEENHPENKNLTIKTWQHTDKIYLSITDNGTGIKQEHLKKIFSHTFTTKKNGHGFGLHSSANYMTEMGGKIEVQSEGEGMGTTFTLIFPLECNQKLMPKNRKFHNNIS